MELDKAITLTQERLTHEGEDMAELLGHFRDLVSPVLIGEKQWNRILDCATGLPIEMGALPFGFELPLHEIEPRADLGVSLASGTRIAKYYEKLHGMGEGDVTTKAILNLFKQMDDEHSPLREIVGPKLMLEYDIGAEPESDGPPGMFLRPGERPILSANEQLDDVLTVVDALVSCVGWDRSEAERNSVKQSYLAQPEDTRTDSFGVFPSRERSIRLAVMGFKSMPELRSYLEATGWPGDLAAVESVVSRFSERASIARTGINIDVQEDGLGPSLGLTLIVKQRYTKDSRYWLDGLTDWDPFLDALSQEDLVGSAKLKELADWVSKPSVLFAKSGRFVLLRGIHHIKLVVAEGKLQKVKAYVFLVLSGALTA